MTKATTIKYLDGFTDKVVVPTTFSDDFQVKGDKETAVENFQEIMKKFPDWLEVREEWIEKYKSISKSLEGNPNHDYVLSLMFLKDSPDTWMQNTAQQNISIGCVYSFMLIQALGEGFFTTGPWLFVRGYSFGSRKKIFEIKIILERVK